MENYLDDAFNSILNQTIGFENLEVIFVDGASTDGSSQIIKEYSDKYENVISIFLDKNSGYVGHPRNIGMYYATSKYLMFLDTGDIFLEDACRLLHNEIISNDFDIVSGVHNTAEGVPEYLWRDILTDPQDSLENRVSKVADMVEDHELEISSIDDCPSVIAAVNISDKIFKRSFIEDNNIKFPEAVPSQDEVFLVDAFLNAHGIKFINKVISRHDRKDSALHQFSKIKIIKRIKAYYMMFYSFMDKNKTDIFKHYLLVIKLRHILVDYIMKCNLPTGDILEILIYAKPLFKLYCNYGGLIPENLQIFEDIACGDFEKALMFIQGENTPKLCEVNCINSTDYSIEHCLNLSDDWTEQFENTNPDLFILYIPDLKHLVLIYRLDDLKNLNDITNHFYSINYPFKH